MAKLLNANGTKLKVKPKDGVKFSLEELQRFVGGHIEIFTLDGKEVMVINEEGKLKGLPVNVRATRLFRQFHGVGDYIVGDALICKFGTEID